MILTNYFLLLLSSAGGNGYLSHGVLEYFLTYLLTTHQLNCFHSAEQNKYVALYCVECTVKYRNTIRVLIIGVYSVGVVSLTVVQG